MAHTQREWRAKTTAFGFCVLGGRTSKVIAERYFDHKPSKAALTKLHDTARLIAIAPGLLAVCKWLEATMDKDSSIWLAIRKHEGCSEWAKEFRDAIAKSTDKRT